MVISAFIKILLVILMKKINIKKSYDEREKTVTVSGGEWKDLNLVLDCYQHFNNTIPTSTSPTLTER